MTLNAGLGVQNSVAASHRRPAFPSASYLHPPSCSSIHYLTSEISTCSSRQHESASVLDLFSLRGKAVLVTGGGQGIGLEISRACAEAGADNAIIYHTTIAAAERTDEISNANRVLAEAFQADVRSKAAIASTIQEIASRFGKLDVVVANSGVCANVSALDYTEEQWRANSSVNYDSVMWTAQAAGRIF